MLLERSCALLVGCAGRIGTLPCPEPCEWDAAVLDMLLDWCLSFFPTRPPSSSSASSSSSAPSSALLLEKSLGVFRSLSPSN